MTSGALARTLLVALALGPAALRAQLPAAPPKPTRVVAVTFDDLPIVSRTPRTPGEERQVIARLVASLRFFRVPAVGFVNEGKLWGARGIDTGRVELLDLWARSGIELGNHTFSHADLHRVSADSFIRDMRRDRLTRGLVTDVRNRCLECIRQPVMPRWFRHPFLHTGRSLAARDSVNRALAERGLAVAPVTIDNYDYQFAAAYDLALGRRDSSESRRIAGAYIAYMERVFAYYEAQSVAIAGREIPQVLLLHANALNADTFERLWRMMRGRGYRFASLDEVVADPVYRSPDTYLGPAGITWLHRWAITRGMPGKTYAGEPEVPAEIVAAGER